MYPRLNRGLVRLKNIFQELNCEQDFIKRLIESVQQGGKWISQWCNGVSMRGFFHSVTQNTHNCWHLNTYHTSVGHIDLLKIQPLQH